MGRRRARVQPAEPPRLCAVRHSETILELQQMAMENGVHLRIPQRLIEGFKSVPPPTIGHARLSGFMDPSITPLYHLGEVIVGRAVTVKLTPGDVTYTRPAIEALGPDDILVMALGGERRVAAWGEMTSLAAQVRGAVGVIIDGACTDLLEITEMRMPTWARGLSALVGRRLSQDGGVNVPIQCGGVLVNPGDLIVADDNGIVVIPPGEAEELYTTACWWEDRSPHQRTWLQHGGSLAELTGLSAEQIAEKNREQGWR
jgi:regulator of RNase E activity RraA